MPILTVRGGGGRLGSQHEFTKFSEKLHEIEIYLDCRGHRLTYVNDCYGIHAGFPLNLENMEK